MRRPRSRFLWLVLIVVLANYAAQVPYVLRLDKTPTPSGTLLLGATFAWFLCGYIGLLVGLRLGY